MLQSRKDFINKLIRAGLAMILLFIAFFLGNRAVTAKNCSGCPGYGACRGTTDCDTYKKESAYERR